eukprot:m.114540 g.114540  ORF g.114540 m.114540 type:complete len:420 (-) comp12822_c3_seq2:1230-2489(-)
MPVDMRLLLGVVILVIATLHFSEIDAEIIRTVNVIQSAGNRFVQINVYDTLQLSWDFSGFGGKSNLYGPCHKCQDRFSNNENIALMPPNSAFELYHTQRNPTYGDENVIVPSVGKTTTWRTFINPGTYRYVSTLNPYFLSVVVEPRACHQILNFNELGFGETFTSNEITLGPEGVNKRIFVAIDSKDPLPEGGVKLELWSEGSLLFENEVHNDGQDTGSATSYRYFTQPTAIFFKANKFVVNVTNNAVNDDYYATVELRLKLCWACSPQDMIDGTCTEDSFGTPPTRPTPNPPVKDIIPVHSTITTREYSLTVGETVMFDWGEEIDNNAPVSLTGGADRLRNNANHQMWVTHRTYGVAFMTFSRPGRYVYSYVYDVFRRYVVVTVDTDGPCVSIPGVMVRRPSLIGTFHRHLFDGVVAK